MKIVIDIPDVVKQRLDAGHIENGSIMSGVILDMIKEGQVLPEGYGDLIERNVLKNTIEEHHEDIYELGDVIEFINDAPSVIKADTE